MPLHALAHHPAGGDVERGNAELRAFLDTIANVRPHPRWPDRRVDEVLAEEKARLLALPDPLPDTDLVVPVNIDPQAFVHFDGNRYSVPSDHADGTLTLVADDRSVRFLDRTLRCVARHERSYGKRQAIELPEHRAELIAQRRAARDLKGRDRLCAVAPQFAALLERWAHNGPSLAIQVTRAIKLLDLYGDEIFAAAVAEVVARGLRDTGALAMACERLRRDRRRPVPVEIRLPAHLDDPDVIPHDLETYDADDE
jgi:hypothetical protein